MDVGTQIRLLRESNHESRELASERLNLCVNTYAKIENGERQPTILEIETISKAYKIDPSIFFAKNGNTYIQNGSGYPGVFGNGNIVSIDKTLLDVIIENGKNTNLLISKVLEKLG